VEANTRSIIELAWARLLHLPDDALMCVRNERITCVHESVLMYVTLWEHRVLVAPERLLERACGVPDEHLRDGCLLWALSADGGGRPGRLLGEATLSFTDSYVPDMALDSVAVTDDAAAVTDLEHLCPPDDAMEVALSKMTWQMATLDDTDQITAGAGFAERQQILAQLGVLTPPPLRRYGFGTLAAGMATNEALDRGLVPQWRCRVDNAAGRAVAARLGFEQVGTQTTVLLG
jgi:hypothetical protein